MTTIAAYYQQSAISVPPLFMAEFISHYLPGWLSIRNERPVQTWVHKIYRHIAIKYYIEYDDY